MTAVSSFVPRFVEYIPREIEPGVLYISMEYAISIHSCACGCGYRVVTPLSSTFWRLTFDGETVSLSPSIGNTSFPCESHYWIERNKVQWAPYMSRAAVERTRRFDRAVQERHYGPAPATPTQVPWIRSLLGRVRQIRRLAARTVLRRG